MTEKQYKIAIYITLISFAAIMVFPFLWSLISSFKTADQIFTLPPTILGDKHTLDSCYLYGR